MMLEDCKSHIGKKPEAEKMVGRKKAGSDWLVNCSLNYIFSISPYPLPYISPRQENAELIPLQRFRNLITGFL